MIRKLLEKTKGRMLVVGACTISFGWIIASAMMKLPSGGGRGGALALILSFAVFFMGNNIAKKSYEITGCDAFPFDKWRPYLVDRLDTADKVSKAQNSYLIVSSIVGTFCWGFGDWIARQL